jgi:alkaline phosphatase
MVSLINSGGIRTAIGEVDDQGQLLPPQRNLETGKEEEQISQFDIVNSLRFNNDLTLLTVTAQELQLLLEHSVAATEEGATPSQFPQVSGLSFSFDPSQAAIAFDEQANIISEGERIQNLSILNADGSVHDVIVEEGKLIGDPSREIRLVTLDFLSGTFSDSDFIGGEGYPFPAFGKDIVNLSEVLTDEGQATFADPGSEHDALAEFLIENFPVDGHVAFNQAETPPTEDERIVNLSVQDHAVDPPASPVIKEPGIFDLTNEDVFGPSGEVVTANLASEVIAGGVFNNLVGFYTVADKAGGIDTDDDGIADLNPGEDGYTQAALANAEDAILKRGQTGSIELTSGEIVVPFLLARGGDLDEIPTELPEGIQAYFPYLAANADGADHFRLLSDNTLGIEDLKGGGDQDFNDLVFQLDFA